MPRNQEMTTSEFYCTCCGNKGVPIARKVGCQREKGHLKKLYCIYCKREVNHVEVRPFGDYTYENFKKEFELGRFVNGERIPTGELLECSNSECKYNVNGRCWNSNNSANCTYKKIMEV